MVNHYSKIEEHIFNKVKAYFEDISSVGPGDYENGFFDIVAQYADGREEGLLDSDLFKELIDVILNEFLKLSLYNKILLQNFYKSNFQEEYFNYEAASYVFPYKDEDLSVKIAGRFKSWVNDSFSLEDMLEADSAEQYFDKNASKDQISFLEEVIYQLQKRPLTDIQRRRLQIANIYLNYHPLVPDEDYIFSIRCKSFDFIYEIVYSHDMISFSKFYTDDGSCFYDYEFRLYKTGEKEEKGELWVFTTYFEIVLEDMQLEIGINNTIP